MKFKKIIMLTAILLCSMAQAAGKYVTVYKWVDDDNFTHYGENPSNQYPSTKVKVLAESFKAHVSTGAKLTEEDELTEEEKANCKQAASIHQKLADEFHYNTITIINEKGEKVQLTPEERKEQTRLAKVVMDSYCKPKSKSK